MKLGEGRTSFPTCHLLSPFEPFAPFLFDIFVSFFQIPLIFPLFFLWTFADLWTRNAFYCSHNFLFNIKVKCLIKDMFEKGKGTRNLPIIGYIYIYLLISRNKIKCSGTALNLPLRDYMFNSHQWNFLYIFILSSFYSLQGICASFIHKNLPVEPYYYLFFTDYFNFFYMFKLIK